MKPPTVPTGLPFSLDNLIHQRAVESNRVELKAAWDPHTRAAVVRTVCAFANDVLNLNGGYVVVGIEEQGGRAELPPRGLAGGDLERLQKEIRGACQLIDPGYQPYLFPVEYEGRPILIIWAPGGDNRPYQAPDNVGQRQSPRHFYLRQGPETVKARGESLRQLMELAAKIPFDDRRALSARLEDISPSLVRRFVHLIGSKLLDHQPQLTDREIYRRLRIVLPVNDHEVPRNAALLFFNDEPDRFFPGARIEVVRFANGAGGDLIEERTFPGPVPVQIRSALDYLKTLSPTLVRKIPGQAEAERTTAYPDDAVEEALVNGVYHRSYAGPPEPLKVYLYPERMEITTCPGPVLGIAHEHFLPGAVMPAVPARNRRIGEFLKELGLAEGRGTGIPKIRNAMEGNGSPPPHFDFDEARSYFRVSLPIHPHHREPTLAGVGEATSQAAAVDPLSTALERLKLRLASGEISLAEYREIKAEILTDLEDPGRSGGEPR